MNPDTILIFDFGGQYCHARVYGYTVAIRAVKSKEAMTASFAKIPYKILE